MRRLTINGKEYTFKFSIEASLYNECTEAAMNLFLAMGEAYSEATSADQDDPDSVKKQGFIAMRKTLMSAANVPKNALTLFYAGLMETHGTSGDNSVRSITDAKKVLADYLRENDKNFYDVMNLMFECMGEDHFFDLTGISEVLNKMGLAEENLDGEEKKKSVKKRKTGED